MTQNSLTLTDTKTSTYYVAQLDIVARVNVYVSLCTNKTSLYFRYLHVRMSGTHVRKMRHVSSLSLRDWHCYQHRTCGHLFRMSLLLMFTSCRYLSEERAMLLTASSQMSLRNLLSIYNIMGQQGTVVQSGRHLEHDTLAAWSIAAACAVPFVRCVTLITSGCLWTHEGESTEHIRSLLTGIHEQHSQSHAMHMHRLQAPSSNGDCKSGYIYACLTCNSHLLTACVLVCYDSSHLRCRLSEACSWLAV